MSEGQPNTEGRNYNTISPSAKSLLLLKGYTNIPFAREAAAIISLPEKYVPDFSKKDFVHWARVLHFEARYNSINQLLSGLPVTNVLELSSGFSFRGLAAIQDKALYYIGTDLPDVINIKQNIIAALPNKGNTQKGKLEVLPMNALDEKQFGQVISHFPEGAVVIVNEGLLMYLDNAEKKKLCRIIRNTLRQMGGYWITADIYVKAKRPTSFFKKEDKMQHFFEAHDIEGNMFESFDAAEAFFKNEGFVIDKEAAPEYSSSGALKYLKESATEEQLNDMGKGGKIHTTWRLRLEWQA